MADYVIPENIAIVIGLVTTGISGAVVKVAATVYKNKNDEIARLNTKVDVLQTEYKALLMAQIEAEPARRAALEKIGATLADQNMMIRSALATIAVKGIQP